MQSVSAGISLPVTETTAFSVITDLNTIIRLSPFFTLKDFEPSTTGAVKEGSIYQVKIEYYQKESTETHSIEVEKCEANKQISYKIDNSILKHIIFTLEPDKTGVLLTQRFLLESGDESILKGSQNELNFWLRSIGEYIKLAEGRSHCRRVQKSFMDKVWLRLSLSERKIAIIMAKITVLEIILLLVMVFIWNIAFRG